METLFGALTQLIGGAEKLGTLGAAAVWAFFTLILIFYIVWTQRTQKQASESAWEARIEEAKADGLIASAISKMADEIKELRHVIDNGGTHV
jgi:hypothetical protein